MASEARGSARVKSIFIYPIKSCKPISVSHSAVSATGFVWDREWMVINSRGRCCTQKTHPNLALVQVEMPPDAFSLAWIPNNSSYMVVRAPGMPDLNIPLTKPCLRSDGVSIWGWSGSALDEGDIPATWFTHFLGKPTRLVRFNEESETRPVDPQYATGHNVKFADNFPFLLISQASLDAVNKQLKEPVNINRFRPNIFVHGCEPFEEDFWKQIKVNDLTFRGVMLCPRCKVTTINQEDATQGSEPIETMKKFRTDEVLEVDGKYKGSPYLGQLLVNEDNAGIVSVGDVIHVEKVFPSYAEVPA